MCFANMSTSRSTVKCEEVALTTKRGEYFIEKDKKGPRKSVGVPRQFFRSLFSRIYSFLDTKTRKHPLRCYVKFCERATTRICIANVPRKNLSTICQTGRNDGHSLFARRYCAIIEFILASEKVVGTKKFSRAVIISRYTNSIKQRTKNRVHPVVWFVPLFATSWRFLLRNYKNPARVSRRGSAGELELAGKKRHGRKRKIYRSSPISDHQQTLPDSNQCRATSTLTVSYTVCK